MTTTSQSIKPGGFILTDDIRKRLFFASCIAMIATAMSFAIRGDVIGVQGAQFHLTKEQLGSAAGAWAYGFTISIFIGGQLCDTLGMGRLLALAFVAHVTGIVLTIFTNGFWLLFAGTLSVGLGNGLIEAAVNPLTATMFPEQKTAKLNQMHVWFPGGIVIGGLVSYFMSKLGFGWQAKTAVILIPIFIYGALFYGKKFPPTERVQQGVSTGGMYRGIMKPLFFVWIFCMLLTSSTELGPNQWIPNILTQTAAMSGILVLVWINGLMAVGRMFAGPIVHRLSPIGLLIASAAFSAIGLFALSRSTTATTAFISATIFAAGVCYFWPTMLGVTSERFPAGGALALAIIGGIGTLSVGFFTSLMGKIYDQGIAQAAGGLSIDVLQSAPPGTANAALWDKVQAIGGAQTLAYVVALPVALIVIFGVIWAYDRSRGGYKTVSLADSHGD